jgi:hypothetical protein
MTRTLLLFAAVMVMASTAHSDQRPASTPSVAPAAGPETPRCCRTCRSGKACGDGCINQERQCKKGAGCACNASDSS